MDLSTLQKSDRLALGAGAVVAITALLSIANEWGAAMALSLAAGAGAIGIVLQPRIAPTVTLPATKATLILGLGAAATLATGLVALDWIGWILEHPFRFDTIQFLLGLAAAVVVLSVGYDAFRAERARVTPPAI
jgi:hypothetical protein